MKRLLYVIIIGSVNLMAEVVTFVGSTMLGAKVIPMLLEGFQKERPDHPFTIKLSSGSSSSGFRAVTDRECDIALSTRKPTEQETLMALKSDVHLTSKPFAIVGLVIVVSSKNPINNLTSGQLRKIWLGEITNWKEVGGQDLPIRAFLLNSSSGTYKWFQ